MRTLSTIFILILWVCHITAQNPLDSLKTTFIETSLGLYQSPDYKYGEQNGFYFNTTAAFELDGVPLKLRGELRREITADWWGIVTPTEYNWDLGVLAGMTVYKRDKIPYEKKARRNSTVIYAGLGYMQGLNRGELIDCDRLLIWSSCKYESDPFVTWNVPVELIFQQRRTDNLHFGLKLSGNINFIRPGYGLGFFIGN